MVAVAEASQSDPEIAQALRDLPEPLVIKPADRWQREQRDAVIVSVGFGRSPQGRVVQRLGALSGVTGAELVLLAATRARRTIVWVTTIDPQDLGGERGSLPGHRALRTLLEGIAAPSPVGGPRGSAEDAELSPLLAGFVRLLRDGGLVVATDVGSGEHRVDIAVADPRDRSRMLVAVDVDDRALHVAGRVRGQERHHPRDLGRLAALPVAKSEKIPLLYEIRAFWEDAAVGNGTGREGSARYRATTIGMVALVALHAFEALAVAAAISLFGLGSGAALATVVGVLIEVPVMLSVVWIVNRSKGWYEASPAVAHNAITERL